jgi:hypothetical protein
MQSKTRRDEVMDVCLTSNPQLRFPENEKLSSFAQP